MSEVQEKVWIVMRRKLFTKSKTPVKAFDDRKDARAYAKQKNLRSENFNFSVSGVKKG